MGPRHRVDTTMTTAGSSRQAGTSRSSRSQTSRYTPLEPEYYGLTITDEKARRNFAAYKGRGIESTWFVNREALETLCLWDDVQRLLHLCEWGYLLTMHVPTYEAQVLEMTSTMDITCKYINQQPTEVSFQLSGVTQTLTTEEINVIYECPRNGRCETAASLYSRHHFWRGFTTE